jgi:hypothetical protein
MADCGCEETRNKLEDYLHGELPDGACQDLEDHFQECPPCCDERDVEAQYLPENSRER